MAGYVVPYADPLTFLLIRFSAASLLLLMLALMIKSHWPTQPVDIMHAVVAGLLMHGFYLGGTWWGIQHGVPTGISGLIAALQPLLTALLAPYLLSEYLNKRQKMGVILGFLGIMCVLSPKAAGVTVVTLNDVMFPMIITVLSVISLTAGTFYQKRFLPHGELIPITIIQYAACALMIAPVAFMIEKMHITWNMTIILALTWSVLGLSLGAIGLLFFLIRQGEVSRTASLIYLVAPLTALQAYLFFNETLVSIQIVGFIFTALGVALATRK